MPMTTGERIRARRLELGLTQRALSERCGIAEPTLRRYEAGKLNPKLSTCQTIATALEVPVVYLLDTSPETRELAGDVGEIIKELRARIQEAQENPDSENPFKNSQPLLAYLEQVQKETTAKALQEDALNKLNQSISDIQETSDAAKRKRKASKLVSAFDRLNDDGQAKAVELVGDLARIPEYQAAPDGFTSDEMEELRSACRDIFEQHHRLELMEQDGVTTGNAVDPSRHLIERGTGLITDIMLKHFASLAPRRNNDDGQSKAAELFLVLREFLSKEFGRPFRFAGQPVKIKGNPEYTQFTLQCGDERQEPQTWDVRYYSARLDDDVATVILSEVEPIAEGGDAAVAVALSDEESYRTIMRNYDTRITQATLWEDLDADRGMPVAYHYFPDIYFILVDDESKTIKEMDKCGRSTQDPDSTPY